ncbi:hypothetical protein [Weissella confusa]|uniref:hypothetical protein n=1 Tax=Weissella confusa TaxID=1583 RepID=UPI0022E2F29D|nr:hypothetical protein [Weissella confusa]
MRLLVVDLGELRQGNVDWQLFVENLLDGGVETVVLLNATQHASAGAPVFFGDGVLPRDGVTRVWADNQFCWLMRHYVNEGNIGIGRGRRLVVSMVLNMGWRLSRWDGFVVFGVVRFQVGMGFMCLMLVVTLLLCRL